MVVQSGKMASAAEEDALASTGMEQRVDQFAPTRLAEPDRWNRHNRHRVDREARVDDGRADYTGDDHDYLLRSEHGASPDRDLEWHVHTGRCIFRRHHSTELFFRG